MTRSKFRPHRLGMAGNGHLVAGERNGRASLSDQLVRLLRRKARHMTYAYLAELIQVAESTVRRAVQRRTWRHVA